MLYGVEIMGVTKGSEIVSEFVQLLNERSGTSVLKTLISKNVFEYLGTKTVLLYVKGRAEEPYKWGVTKNIIQQLRCDDRPWMVVLLFESPESGYLLTEEDTEYYIENVWPVGSDGDYKPASSTYLANNTALRSIDAFISEIGAVGTV